MDKSSIYDQHLLLDCMLEMGELLLDCGAEISRVEDTLERMGKAYGANRVDVFVIPSLISITLNFPVAIPGTETRYDVDVMCISVGLSPLNELLAMRGVEMKYVGQLSGYVPMRTENCETCIPGIFVAGDASGIEEASSAMAEGYLAGLCAAAKLGHVPADFEQRRQEYLRQLDGLRSGPVGERIRAGMKISQL